MYIKREAPKLNRSYEEDLVCDRYRIILDQSIRELSNDFVKYYACVDELTDSEEYFAIVYETFFCPIDILYYLKSSDIKGIIKPIEYGLTQLSTDKTFRLVVIIDAYDHRRTLKEFLSLHGALNDEYIKNQILEKIGSLIDFCNERRIACGNINTNNLIFIEDELFLREIFTQPSNFYQKEYYLSTELLICSDNISRATNFSYGDLYALGVVCCIALDPINITDDDADSIKQRIKEGSYNFFSSLIDLEGDLLDSIEILLSDSIHIRKEFLRHNRSKLFKSNFKIPKEFNITVNGNRVSNIAHMYYEMINNWDEFNKVVSQEAFGRMIFGMTKNTDGISKLTEIRSLPNEEEKKISLVSWVMQSNIVSLRDFTFDISAFPTIVLYSYFFKKENKYPAIISLIKDRMWNLMCKRDLDSSSAIISKLETSYELYDQNYQITSLERLIYDLNPDLPCMSKFLSNEYLISELDVVVEIENTLINNGSSYDKILIDSHIIAFLASKLNYCDTRFFANLNKIGFNDPNNFAVYMLQMLIVIKNYNKNISTHNLSMFIGAKISELFSESVHSINLKKMISAQIIEGAEEENLEKISDIISNQDLYKNDRAMHLNAISHISKLTNQIKEIDENDSSIAFFFGQKITVFASYAICILATIIMVM
jgi:eukaryotic-like serine/threonine-protein kinase